MSVDAGAVIPWQVRGQNKQWREHYFTQAEADAGLLRCGMWVAGFDPKKIRIWSAPRITVRLDPESGRDVFYVFARITVYE